MIKKYSLHKTIRLGLIAVAIVGINFLFVMRLSGLSYGAYTWQKYVGSYGVELAVTIDGAGVGSVNITPPGINCSDDCSETYDDGTVVTLTATADNSSVFSGWSGACSGTNTCMVTMDTAKNVTATFALKESYSLTVNVVGTGSGSVSSSPIGIDCGTDCSETYDDGTVVILTAEADNDSVFTGWSGACNSTSVCMITMDSVKNVTATFTTFTIYLPAVQKPSP